MRLVSVENIKDNMILARALYDGRGMLILPAGSSLSAHKEQFANFSIRYLYVEDNYSEGIDMSQLLCEETRLEIHETVRKVKRLYQHVEDSKKKTFFDLPYVKLAKMITEDIVSQENIQIDVTEFIINRIYEFDHDLNVGILSALIGRAFGMTSDNVYQLCLGGFLHDIGLLALPEAIMEKFGTAPMIASDLSEYRQYPLMGYDMLKHNQVLTLMTKTAVLQHKEWFDGSGFPSHKRADEISLAAKIVAVANTFEKLYFGRDPEQGKMKIHEIVRQILQSAGSAFDPSVIAVFIKHLVIFPNGTMVKLNNGGIGVVEQQNPGQIARPIVRVIVGKSWERIDLSTANVVIEDVVDI